MFVVCVVCAQRSRSDGRTTTTKKNKKTFSSYVRRASRVMWSDVDVSAQVIGQLLTLPVNAS